MRFMGIGIPRLKSGKGYFVVLVISLIAIAVVARSAITKTRQLSALRDRVFARTVEAVPVQADQNTQSNAPTIEQLDAIRQKYANVRSVHARATVKIDLYGASQKSGNGSYEYWAEGDRYKVQCRTDRALDLVPDRDIAYDGERFYFFDRATKMLSYRKEDEPKSHVALPSPFFLPLDFVSSDDDDCDACALRLRDLRSPSATWKKRSEALEVKSRRQNDGKSSILTVLEMPGGVLGRRPYKLRLVLAQDPGGTYYVAQIDRVAADGSLLTSITFGDLYDTAVGKFPRTISVQAFGENGQLMMRMVYSLTALEFNQPTYKSMFSVDFIEPEGVWDSDQQKLVKKKPTRSH